VAPFGTLLLQILRNADLIVLSDELVRMVGDSVRLLDLEFGFRPELVLECFVFLFTKRCFLVGERTPSGKVFFLIR